MAADLRVSLKNLAASQLPEFVRAEYPTFVAFVEAYYEYLDSQTIDMENVRDIDTTLDEYIKYFKAELAHNYPVVSTDTDRERFLLKHIKEQYLAKGSEASYKLLFRLLYGKDVFIDYPGRNMLRVSDGRWTQDVSIFVKVGQGDPNTLVGKTINIQTGKKIYNTKVVSGVDSFSGVTASVQKVVVVNEALNIWEIYLDRNFYGDISPNNTVKYGSKFQATILPTTAKIKINDPGKGFRPGQVFQLNTGEGTPFWFKVATVTDTGGLKTIDVIKFGLFYNTSFSVTVLPTSAVTSKKKRNTVVSDLTYTVSSNGKIVDYKILNAGQNYEYPPLIEITGDGTGAQAHSVIEDGRITEIVIDDLGEGYTEVYAQITNAPGDVIGTGGSVKPVIGSDYDYKFNDKTAGFTESGYANMGDYWDSSEHGRFASAIVPQLRNDVITNINMVSYGEGYTTATVNITDSTGTGTTATPVIKNGVIKSIDIINAGSGYTIPPTITITGGDPDEPAKAVAVLGSGNDEGKVVSINLIEMGSGYNEPPTITITGNGSGATAESILVDGVIKSITIDSFGHGYTDPTITITGDGSGATVSSTIKDGCITEYTIVNGGSNYDIPSPIVDVNYPQDDGINIPGSARAIIKVDGVTNGVITSLKVTYPGHGYLTTPVLKIVGSYGYANGGYVGTIARQFFINAADTLGDNPAILNVSLDAVSKYPGYYRTNDGFLDDSMMIQDSYYFQAFAYVLKIDEQLEKYASVVRSMLHPSGMAMFGEYSINNKIALGVGLTSLVKSLGVTLYDSVIASDGYELDSNGNVIRGSYFSFYKYLEITYGSGTTGHDTSNNYYYPTTEGSRWTPNTSFAQNEKVFYETNIYQVTTAGVSAADEVTYDPVTGSRTVFSHPPTHSVLGSSAVNGTLVLLNIGRYDGFSDSNKFNTTKSFGHGTLWYASTAVELNEFIHNGDKYYLVVNAGVTGTSAPSHTTGDLSNGTAVLRYVGTTATSLASTPQYQDIVSRQWASNITVSRNSWLYYQNRKYIVTVEGVTGNTPPTDVLTSQNNGTCQLQYIGSDVALVTDQNSQQVAQYTDVVGDPNNSIHTTEIRNYVFGKAIGLTGQTETVFMTELVKKNFGKSVADTTSLVEIYTKLLTTKAFTDFAPMGEQHAITFTLNTINDPTSGVYMEEGFVTMEPYDLGSYQAEHYANERPSTFSS